MEAEPPRVCIGLVGKAQPFRSSVGKARPDKAVHNKCGAQPLTLKLEISYISIVLNNQSNLLSDDR